MPQTLVLYINIADLSEPQFHDLLKRALALSEDQGRDRLLFNVTDVPHAQIGDALEKGLEKNLERASSPVPSQEKMLRTASDAFHRIVSAIGVEKLLSREGYKMPTQMFETFTAKKLTLDEMSKVAADGFELCVRALADLGATDVSIHECGEADLEAHW